MKIRITLMTENDKPIPEGCSKEELERKTKMAWTVMMNALISAGDGKNEKVVCEKAEIIE